MAVKEVPLDEHTTVTAAADGTAVATIGPVRRQVWTITNEALTGTSPVVGSTATPTAKMYLGPAVPGGYLAGTYDGLLDSASIRVRLTQGGLITVVWEGCDPGTVCTVSAFGTMLVPA